MRIQKRSYPLSPNALVLGRSSDNPGSSQPDLPLEALTHPESLEWYDGAGGGNHRDYAHPIAWLKDRHIN